MMSGLPLTPPAYATWLKTLKSRIQSARISAARSTNRELILLYWDLGRGIVEKQQALGWGKSVVERLSADLQAKFLCFKYFLRREPLSPIAALG